MRRTQFVASSVLLLCACTVGPDFHAPEPPPTQQYTREPMPAATVAASGTNGTAQAFVEATHAPPQWWTKFQSDELNELVDIALKRSPTLDSARAKLKQAGENYAAQAGLTELPTIDASVSASRQTVDIAALGISGVPSPGPFSLFNASVSVSYLLDFAGGNRRTLEALRSRVDYNAYELDAAQLTLAGNVVSGVIRRASFKRQIELTQALENEQTEQLAIINARYAAGGVALADVHSQRTLVAQTQASLPALLTQLSQVEHQLAILLGEPPSNAKLADIALDSLHLPDAVPLTLPSTLARERPDIRAALALLHEASANIGVATANLYPAFLISAGAGSQRTRIGGLPDSLNIWNFGLSMTQPIFRGGALRAQKRASVAAYQAALADYRETVLQSLEQVANALRALQDDAQALQAREIAAGEARSSMAITRAQYAAGGVGRSELLDAERQVSQTSLDRTRAHADRLADTAALFQALGGGWTTNTPPF